MMNPRMDEVERAARGAAHELHGLLHAATAAALARSLPSMLDVLGVPRLDVINAHALDYAIGELARRRGELQSKLRIAGNVAMACAVDELLTVVGLDNLMIGATLGIDDDDVEMIRNAVTS